MNPLKAIACLAAIVAMLGLVACGGDDDSDTTSETTAAETTAEPTGATGAEGGSEANTLNVEADPGGQLAYTETELSVPAGDVTVEFDNPSQVPHDVAFNDPSGEQVGKTEVITDSSTSIDLTGLEPGEYQFYCTVPGHQEAGMEGTLTVE